MIVRYLVAPAFLLASAPAFAQSSPAPALGWFGEGMHLAARAVEAVGVLIILAGAIVALGRYTVALVKSTPGGESYRALRADLGRAILLGLEFLVAADIVGTVVVQPTLTNLGVLGLIVLIRTFLSVALEVEIQGAWPWRLRELGGETRESDREAG